MKKINISYVLLWCLTALFTFSSCDTGGNSGKTGTTTTPSSTPTTTPSNTSDNNSGNATAPETPTSPSSGNDGSNGVPAQPSEPTDPQAEPAQPTVKEGDCIYLEYKGLAKVKSITEAPEEGDNCPNALAVNFSFGPINQSDIKKYKYTLFKDDDQFLTINGGMNPSKEWVDRNGIEEGTILQCSRKELFQGDCALVVFDFSEIDTNPKDGCK